MLNPPKTERLIALLRAQRAAFAWRSVLTRNSPAWTVASVRLDDLNDQIMKVGAFGSGSRLARPSSQPASPPSARVARTSRRRSS